MPQLEEILQAIVPVDPADCELAWKRWDSIAKPLRSLGKLEEAVVKLAGMRRGGDVCFQKPCVVPMCADNGVVEEGVTQTGQEVTAIVAKEFVLGTTPMCRMARMAGADVIPVDLGVYRDVDAPGLIVRKIAYGTKNIAKGPAMSRDEAVRAIEAGIQVTLDLERKGYDLFATGEMGIGNTTTSSAMTAVLLGKTPEEVTGRGAGLSSEGLKRKVAAVHRAIEENRPDPQDPIDVLAKVGGFDIGGMIGTYLGAAYLRRPAVIDGFISSVAALCAVRLCPAAIGYILPSHMSSEPAGRMVMEALGLKPFLDCGMSLGEGSGAVAVLPLLRMACGVYREMGTFGDIHMEGYQPLI